MRNTVVICFGTRHSAVEASRSEATRSDSSGKLSSAIGGSSSTWYSGESAAAP